MVALAEAWGAGVLTGTNGRGTVPEDHPLLIGNFPADEAVLPLYEEADCLLTIGSHLRGNETQNFALPLPERHVQIDLDAEVIGKNFPVTVGLQADARSAVAALTGSGRQALTAALTANAVRNVEGADFGVVSHLFSTGANDVLVAHGDRERMIPFVLPDYIVSIDFDAGLVTVDWDPEF